MENLTLQQLITQTKEALTQAGASNYYKKVFKTLTNQLLLYAKDHNTDVFSMDFGLQFLEDHYSMTSKIEQKKWCATYSRCINALAEYQRSCGVTLYLVMDERTSTTKYSTLFGKLSELLNGIHKKRLCMFLITV